MASLALATLNLPPLVAEEALPPPPAILVDDPAPLLGLSLAEAWGRFGPPAKVSALRGDAAWQDDVVFTYPAGFALSWTGDRLWQVRFLKGYQGSVYGVFIGDSAEKLVSLLGTPFATGDSAYVFRLPWKAYPVRLRAVLSQGKVDELDIYRADF